MNDMADAAEALAKSNFEAEMGDGWESLPAQIRPGWINEANRQIAALSAAGFGPVKEAKAEAWDEGASWSNDHSTYWRDDNPYRATS